MRPTHSPPKFMASSFTRLAAVVVVLLSATICDGDDPLTPLDRARSLLNRANLAEDKTASVLVRKAQTLLAKVRSPVVSMGWLK